MRPSHTPQISLLMFHLIVLLLFMSFFYLSFSTELLLLLQQKLSILKTSEARVFVEETLK